MCPLRKVAEMYQVKTVVEVEDEYGDFDWNILVKSVSTREEADKLVAASVKKHTWKQDAAYFQVFILKGEYVLYMHSESRDHGTGKKPKVIVYNGFE